MWALGCRYLELASSPRRFAAGFVCPFVRLLIGMLEASSLC